MFHCNVKVALEPWIRENCSTRGKRKIIFRNKLVNRPFHHTPYISPINLCTTNKKKKRAKSACFFPRESVLTSVSTLFSRRQSSRIHKDDCWKIVASRTANFVHYSWIRKLENPRIQRNKRDHEDRFKIILDLSFRFNLERSMSNSLRELMANLEHQNSQWFDRQSRAAPLPRANVDLIRREWRTNVCTGFNWQCDAGCLRISKCVARWTGEMCIIRRMFALLRHYGSCGDGVWWLASEFSVVPRQKGNWEWGWQ